MLDVIHAKRDEIYAIARPHGVVKLWVFGSCARKEERPGSDVDFLAEFRDFTPFGAPSALSCSFSALLGRRVDVVSSKGLNPYLRNSIRKEAIPL
jgi:hypothetical protein